MAGKKSLRTCNDTRPAHPAFSRMKQPHTKALDNLPRESYAWPQLTRWHLLPGPGENHDGLLAPASHDK